MLFCALQAVARTLIVFPAVVALKVRALPNVPLVMLELTEKSKTNVAAFAAGAVTSASADAERIAKDFKRINSLPLCVPCRCIDTSPGATLTDMSKLRLSGAIRNQSGLNERP